MGWLVPLIRGLFEALFNFKKEKVVAKDSKAAPIDLRRSWADRITDIMRKQPKSGSSSSDHMGEDGGREDDSK